MSVPSGSPIFMTTTDPKIRSTIMREMGRSGGLKGGVIRAAKLTPAQRKEIATQAANVRWDRWTTNMPKRAGWYDFRCGETDRMIERLKVENIGGVLAVQCPHIGQTHIEIYHHNLDHPEWRFVASVNTGLPQGGLANGSHEPCPQKTKE